MPAIVARCAKDLLTSAKESADETTDNCRAKRHPSSVISAVMAVNIMMFMVVARSFMMMFLRCVMFESSVVCCRPVKIVLKPVAVSHILRHSVFEE